MSALLLALSIATAADLHDLEVHSGTPAVGTVEATVDLPVDVALAVIMDCEHVDAWFPDMVDTHDAGGARCAGGTDLPWPLADRTWTIEAWQRPLDDGAWEAGAHYLPGSGNLEAMDARWVLTPTADGRTHVVYEAKVDLGVWLPEPVLNWATRQLLPGIVEGLERYGSARSTAAVAALSADRTASLPL